MSSVYLWAITSYFLLLVIVAVRGSRGVSTQEDFSVAGRRLGTFVLSFTMIATWIGSGSFFGNSEKTYEVGLSAWILPVASIMSIFFLSFVAGRARALQQITIPDLLERRYNLAARLFGTLALLMAYSTILSYQFRAAGAVLNLALPELPYQPAVVLSAIFIVLYTTFGGMVSVAHIGVVSGITMIVGMSITFVMLFMRAGGVEGMREVLEPSHFQLIGPIGFVEAIGLSLPTGLLILAEANLYQRFFSARTALVAKKAALWTALGVTFLEAMIILNAWVGSSLIPEMDIPGRVIPYAARDFLPVGLGALMLTTVMAIVLSTATSCLLVPATTLVRDIYQRFLNPQASGRTLVVRLRIATILLGLVAYFLSTLSDRFLSVALLAYTIWGTSIAPALIATFFWRRATGAGAVASIATGTTTTLLWNLLYTGPVKAVIPAITLSVAALVIVSLLTEPTPPEKVEPFFNKEALDS